MIDLDRRRAILMLRAKGHGVRTMARTLGLSRNAVRRILKDGQDVVPRLEREELPAAHLDTIRQLHDSCDGNLVRVHEELAAKDIQVGYSTLTSFCRRHGIGVKPKVRSGRYHFEPGEQMQHDTSPHQVTVGGRRRFLHCASLVLCCSRWIYAQIYPVWDRFHAKIFINDALVELGGSAGRCVVDNSSVVIAHGTGREAVPGGGPDRPGVLSAHRERRPRPPAPQPGLRAVRARAHPPCPRGARLREGAPGGAPGSLSRATRRSS